MRVFLVLLISVLELSCEIIPNITLQWYNEDCFGGDKALLTTGLRLKYTSYYDTKNYTNSTWIDFNSTLPDLVYSPPGNPIASPLNQIQYIFYQPEHGGGGCHCVDIYFNNKPNKKIELCGGEAQNPRAKCIQWSSKEIKKCMYTSNQNKEIPFQMNNFCRDSQNILKVSFDFITYCENDTIGGLDSLELSIRFISSIPTEWIPILLIVFRQSELKQRRGYNNVRQIGVIQSERLPMKHHLTLCNFILVESVQLRWLLSSHFKSGDRDIWSLDNIEIIQKTPFSIYTHLNESFSGNSINSQSWNSSNIRNGKISFCSNCNNSALVFGENVYFRSRSRHSHSVLTDTFSLRYEPYHTVSTAVTTVEVSPTEDALSVIDKTIRTKVLSNMTLVAILNDTNVTTQLSDYNTLLEGPNQITEVLIYVFADIFTKISDSYCEPQIFMKAAVLGNKVIQFTTVLKMPSENLSAILGPTLLFTLDQFVLNCVNSLEYSNNKIFATQSMAVDSMMSSVYKFASSTYNQWSPPYVEVAVPIKELQNFSVNGYLRLTFNIFRNISSILPEESNGSQLVSDVIGISLRCKNEVCSTDSITLSDPIRLIFNHSDSLTNCLRANQSLTTHCAFLRIPYRETRLKSGQWSSEGCEKNEVLSSPTGTTCECTHLTYFGILLSAREISLNHHHRFALSIIGYVGVGISCTAMLCTVICFILFKTFHNMRTYIHVNLCINLTIAQLIFVAGIDRTGDSVPIHCQVIAVLLHYFFLVSFMWMLMEGVFLYFALVKVFIANPKKYVTVFTAMSYGLPLLYMGFLTLPLGFGFSEKQYGYHEACYLQTDSHFIWTFIAPVIIIFICNSIFILMAAIIMWKQERRRDIKTESNKVFKWIKAVASLTVVMGLTWIIGVLIVEREELLSLAYIYTIIVAFQGFFIFLVLVVFTTSVRDKIRRWIVSKLVKLRANTSSDTNTTVLSNPMSLKDMTPEDLKN